jgi:hypothetical protein
MNSTGVFRYSPMLLGSSQSKWWLVLDCDPDLNRYYRHLYHLHTYRCQKLLRPAWESHITVVRDEKPPNEEFWDKYNGQEVEFTIIPQLETNNDYYWFPVECDLAMKVREELGLGLPIYPLHISIGRKGD